MAEKGWIKLYRQITGNVLWTSDEPFDRRSAWIDLIMMANVEDKQFINHKGQTVTVHRGQTFTSLQGLQNRWFWSRGKVNRYLTLLTRNGMIVKDGTPSGTLITIKKYDVFQGGRNGKRNADGTANG